MRDLHGRREHRFAGRHRGQVGVKAHRNVPEQKASRPGDGDLHGRHFHEPVGLEFFERLQRRFKILLKIDAELLLHRRNVQLEVAHEPHDDVLPQRVVPGHAVPDVGRQPACIDRPVVLLQVLLVLGVARLKMADRRHAEPVEVSVGPRGVALEVPVQRLPALRPREFVVRFRRSDPCRYTRTRSSRAPRSSS